MIDSIPTATLLMKAGRHPLRAVRRLMDTARLSRLINADEREGAGRFLSDVFHVDVERSSKNANAPELGAWMQRRHAQLEEFPSYRLGATPTFDCETIYCLIRAMRPSVVVETGVCYGGRARTSSRR